MTDKEYFFQKKRIQKLARKWVHSLGLGWWNVKIEYDREEPHGDMMSYSPKDVDGRWVVHMETRCDPNYLKATITCYLLPIANMKNDEELEEMFLHELMHIFVSPMKSDKKAAEEERVATTLARAFQYIDRQKK